MLNRTACRELLEFLDAIECRYSGVASFENARLHARIALEMFDKQRADQQDVREKIEKVRRILKILEHENMIAGDALDLLNEICPQK